MAVKAYIDKIASYLPDTILTNEEISRLFPEWSIEKIANKTGINVRAIASANECASDLAVKAAKKLFFDFSIDPLQIDFLLFCTQSPDYFLPTSACNIHLQLELKPSCGALDINLGCSGYVYGLSLAKGLIESGLSQKVLFLTADTYSKYIHVSDKSVRTIFSDGAAATLVSGKSEAEDQMGPFIFGTDGRGGKNLIVPAGGHRLPKSIETSKEIESEKGIFRSQENLKMNGGEIFNFTLEVVPEAIECLLKKANIKFEQVDYFIFHQANKFMLEQLRQKIKIPSQKFCINLESYGNTVSSTIPMALEIALNEGSIVPGNTVMLVGFGVGYSWAASLIRI